MYYGFSVFIEGNVTWNVSEINNVTARFKFYDETPRRDYKVLQNGRNFTMSKYVGGKPSEKDDLELRIDYNKSGTEANLRKKLKELCPNSENCIYKRKEYDSSDCMCYFKTIHLS
uniref:Lipocalin n=1 Tax=Strongyloides papillosus TaxID=174720 RepID=A0A0N5BQK7_STREA